MQNTKEKMNTVIVSAFFSVLLTNVPPLIEAVITKGMIFNQYHLEHQKHQHVVCPHKVQTIKIGAIIPNDTSHMFSIMKASPVIGIGINIVYHFNLLPCHKLVVKYADSKCSMRDGPLAAFNFYMRKDVHVFFGPVCDYALAAVARYAFAWNIPVITTGGFAHDFEMKDSKVRVSDLVDTFPTLTRVHLTFTSLAKFIITVIKYHNWHSIKIIYNKDGHGKVEGRFCYLAISAFVRRVRMFERGNLAYHLYLLHPEEDDFDTFFMEEISNKYAGK